MHEGSWTWGVNHHPQYGMMWLCVVNRRWTNCTLYTLFHLPAALLLIAQLYTSQSLAHPSVILISAPTQTINHKSIHLYKKCDHKLTVKREYLYLIPLGKSILFDFLYFSVLTFEPDNCPTVDVHLLRLLLCLSLRWLIYTLPIKLISSHERRL